MKIRRSLLKDTVAVETYSGDSAYGPIYAASTSIHCHIDARRHLIRNTYGDEVVSEATLYVHPDDAAPFTPESRVTIPTGRVSSVLTVAPSTWRGNEAMVMVSIA